MYNPSFTVWESKGHVLHVMHCSDDSEDVGTILPNFFNKDFNIATSTGFTCVWEGSKVFRSYIEKEDTPISFKGKNCIELGSGCGMLGLHLAALGANVLLSDVESVTRDSTSLNVRLNAKRADGGAVTDTISALKDADTSKSGAALDKGNFVRAEGFFAPSPIEAYVVANGTAAAAPIDWNSELSDEIKAACAGMDYLIGCECVWLPDLLQPFAKAMARCLIAAKRPNVPAIVCYPVRGNKPTSYFTNQKQFEEACEKEGLSLEMLSFTPRDTSNKDSLDVCIYRITLTQ